MKGLSVSCPQEKYDRVIGLIDEIISLLTRSPHLLVPIGHIIRTCIDAGPRFELGISHITGIQQAPYSVSRRCAEILHDLYTVPFPGWTIHRIRAHILERLVRFIEVQIAAGASGAAVYCSGKLLLHNRTFCERGHTVDILVLNMPEARVEAAECKVNLDSYVVPSHSRLNKSLLRQLVYMHCIDNVVNAFGGKTKLLIVTFQKEPCLAQSLMERAGFNSIRIVTLSDLKNRFLSAIS